MKNLSNKKLKEITQEDVETPIPKRFQAGMISMKGSHYKTPKGFIEEDMREYREQGAEQIEEALNYAFYDYENQKLFVEDPKTKERIYGSSMGDIMVEIQDLEEEVTVLVYRLCRIWNKPKKEVLP